MLFLDSLTQQREALGDKTAIAFIDGPELTYDELGETVNRGANYLRHLGIGEGDRVAVQLPKCLPFIAVHLASMQIGAVFLPLNPAYPPAETRYFLDDSGAKLLISDGAKRRDIDSIATDLDALERTLFIDPVSDFVHDLARWSAERDYPRPGDPHQTAMMLYTSGTTSRPKGAKITHGNLTANIAALHQAWGWREDDVLLHALPIFPRARLGRGIAWRFACWRDGCSSVVIRCRADARSAYIWALQRIHGCAHHAPPALSTSGRAANRPQSHATDDLRLRPAAR